MTNPPRLNRRTFLAGATAAAAAAACSSGAPDASNSSASSSSAAPASGSSPPAATSGRAVFVSAGARTKPLVALTFHVSGDRALAIKMLDLLRTRRAPITAFMVGTFVQQNPDLVPRFAADGHELANHTYSHLTFGSLARPQMTDEITRCRDAITKVTGSGGRLFRPSGTANGTDPVSDLELDVAGAAGYPTVVGYDVDPADYADPGAGAVTARTVNSIQAGSIVSLHFGHQGTIDALPDILTAIDGRGLRPVTASALLMA